MDNEQTTALSKPARPSRTGEAPSRSDHRRAQLLDEARACGRMGANRLSDTVLFGNGRDPTQTLILAALDAFEHGKKQREGGGT